MGYWVIGKSLEDLVAGWNHVEAPTRDRIKEAIKKAYELGKADG